MNSVSFEDFMGKGSPVAPDAGVTSSGAFPMHTLYQVESGGNRSAVNPSSGAYGAGQVIPSTWSKMGGGDPKDPAEQDRVAQKVWDSHSKDLSGRLGGAELQDWQKYIAYQQGPGGAHALLTAKPDAKAIDVLTPVYGNAATARKAIIDNGGKEGTTAGEFVQLVKGKWDKHAGGAARPVAQATTGDTSFEDFMGMPKAPPSTLDNVKGWLKDEVLPAAGGALKSGAELLAAGPGMLVGAVAGTARSAEEMLKGTPRRTALQAGAETAGRVGAALNPITVATNILGYKPDPSVVDSAMEKLGKGIHHYGEVVESQYKYPNGEPVLMAEDVDAFANMLMGIGGGKATKAGAQKVMDRVTADKLPPTDPTRATYGPEPTPMTPEETVRAQTIGPRATAQEHINESIGIKSTKEREAFTRQRAKDVRAAFKEDPDFADYLRFQAEELVTRRELGDSARATAAAASAKTAEEMNAAATWQAEALKAKVAGFELKDPVKQKSTEGTVIGEQPSALEQALQRQREVPGFQLTPEERITLQRVTKGKAGFLDQYGKPIVGLAAAGGLIALYQTDPEKAKDLGLLGGAVLMTGGKIGEDVLRQPASSLAAARKASDYTLLTLERLPQNRSEFPKSMIAEQLKRADVTKAEKDVLQQVLDQTPDDKITAVELVKAVKNATGDWELTPKETTDYADYGLENITPAHVEGDNNYHPGRGYTEGTPTTTLYQLPEHMKVSDANHFNDPRLFGWTRSFDEGGVPHTVEIQSDLAQHAKTIAPEVKTELTAAQEDLQTQIDALRHINTAQGILHRMADLYKANPDLIMFIEDGINSRMTLEQFKEFNPEHTTSTGEGHLLRRIAEKATKWNDPIQNVVMAALNEQLRPLEMRFHENAAKLGAGKTAESLSPMLKNWPKRLIREDLAASAREGKPVHRFATADTVAKVEGWPDRQEAFRRSWGDNPPPQVAMPIERFSPEHQSIYDRYKKDIEKFLRQQGGVDHTDAYGHTWIEVPTEKFKGPKQMLGQADPALLARMALIGGGALAGVAADKDNRLIGGLLGALGGAALAGANPAKVVQNVREAFKPDTRIRVDGLANAHEVAMSRATRTIAALQTNIEKLVPKLERRVAMTHAIETGDMKGLSGAEIKAVEMARAFFAQMSKAGLDSGVLKNSLDNYVTHLWGTDEKTKSIMDSIFGEKAGGPSMSPESRFALRRSIPTIAEGKALGMTPLTEDLSAILGVYGNSIIRSMENRTMLNALKAQEVPGLKQKLVMPAAKAPAGYVPIQHPQMAGMLVHPDIAPSLRFIFDSRAPGPIQAGLLGLNTLTKRLNVSFSLFHAKALMDALIGAASNPLTVGKTLLTSALGTNKYLKMLREGGAGDLVDKALLGGLKFEMRSAPALEELNNTFYDTFKNIQDTLDSTIPYSGLPVAAFIKMNHAVDTLMWSRLHAGMKLSIFAEKFEKLTRNNAEANAKDPSVKLKIEEDIAKIAASFTNDIFGGLNWRRAAEDAKTKWGRDLKLSAFGPTGRRVMQIGLFAPDWTISTTRAAVKAFGKGTGLKGILKPTELADLHRQYVLRSAMYYLVVGDAINYAMSGHHLWQNKDWSSIDLGDGRTMQWSKHTMEPVHWLTKPGQQGLNKLGFAPREVMNQAMGSEYLSTSGHAPRMDTSISGRLAHASKGLTPISVQQGFQAGKGSGVAGWLGAPIYGRTYAEREMLKEQQKESRKESAADRKEKRLEARQ